MAVWLYQHEIGPGSSPLTSTAWMVSSSTITFALSGNIQGQSSEEDCYGRRGGKEIVAGLHGDHP